MSLFARVDVGLADHPRTARLARALGVDDDTALGIVTRLILRGVTRASRDGVLRDEDEASLEHTMRRPGVARALIDAGFLAPTESGGLVIVGWAQRTGAGLERLEEARAAATARKQASRARAVAASEAEVTPVLGHASVTPRSHDKREREKEQLGGGAKRSKSPSAAPTRPPNEDLFDPQIEEAIERTWSAWRSRAPRSPTQPERPPVRARHAVTAALHRGCTTAELELAVSAAAVDDHWCGRKPPHHYQARGGPPDPFEGFPASLSASQIERYIADGRRRAEESERAHRARQRVQATIAPPPPEDAMSPEEVRALLAAAVRPSQRVTAA